MDLLTTFDPSTMAGLLNQLDLHLTSPLTTSGEGDAITSAADDDLIGWATQKALDIQQLFRVVAVTVAAGVMVWAMFFARMALAQHRHRPGARRQRDQRSPRAWGSGSRARPHA